MFHFYVKFTFGIYIISQEILDYQLYANLMYNRNTINSCFKRTYILLEMKYT